MTLTPDQYAYSVVFAAFFISTYIIMNIMWYIFKCKFGYIHWIKEINP